MTEYKTNQKNKKIAVSCTEDEDVDQVAQNAFKLYRKLFPDELFFKISVRMAHYSDDPIKQNTLFLIGPEHDRI